MDIKKEVCKNTTKRKQLKEKWVYYLFAENIVMHDLSSNKRKCVKKRMKIKQQKKPSKD